MPRQTIYFRIIKDHAFKGLVLLFSFLMIVPLLLILYHIVRQGFSVIDWDFLTGLPRPIGEAGGGIANSILGTFLLILIAGVLAIPLGICAGIYLSEHQKGRLSDAIRLCTEILQGVPSIVLGIIAYAWVVLSMGTFSALSGGVALAIMMLPVIVRSTEETLKLIPDSLREASLALGVPYSRTVLKVIVPAGLTGILTGVLLGIARIAGETAPLLFTAFGSQFINMNIFKPVDSLPLVIFTYATSPYPEWHAKAWGASCILVLFVLGLNITAKMIVRRWKVRF